MTLRVIVVAGLLLASAWQALAAPPTPRITDLQPIPLASGVNQIHGLAPDGRDGLIVLGWRDNGNAHGYDLALVLLQEKPEAPFDVVGVSAPGEQGWTDDVTDAPHFGIDAVRSFRFAKGRLDGRAATLLLTATREPGETIPSPSRVTFEVYALQHGPEVGLTPDHFTLITTDRSTDPYCNAEMALSKRFALKLRPSYTGPRTANGCS